VLDNNIINGGEYQINDGIKGMMANGKVFKTGEVSEWMDCGNKTVTLETNQRMLGFLKADGEEQLVSNSVVNENSKIIEPCYIGENVKLENTTVGPNVSIGNNCIISNSTIKNSLIQNETTIKNANLDNAMIGVDFNALPQDDLGNVSSKFQDLFYEALQERAIENYGKAVTALQKAIDIDDSYSILYFELGKNYNKLKNFGEAEDAI